VVEECVVVDGEVEEPRRRGAAASSGSPQRAKALALLARLSDYRSTDIIFLRPMWREA
jgi:hypothetical protein